MLFAVCLQTSFLTPPVGFAIFSLKGVAPFVALPLIGLVVIFFWSELVTWLLAMAYGN